MRVWFLILGVALNLMPAFAAGGKIAFSSNRDGNNEIYVMNADGTSPTNLTNTPSVNENYPSWRLDGGRIVYARTDDIWTMKADGTDQTRIVIGYDPSWPDYDPTGQKITYSRSGSSDKDVYVNTVDGLSELRVINEPFGDYVPRWSPDGNRIAASVFGEHGGGYLTDIYTVKPDGTGLTALTTNGGNACSDWSPDSSKIVFRSQRDGNDEIYLMNADGSNPKRLTTNSAGDSNPAFSPDGTQIAFSSNRDGNWEIYVMNADGTGQTRLTTNAATDDAPSWGSPIAAGSPTLNISDATVSESDSGTTNLAFIVRLSAASTQSVTVQYQTSDGTATAPADYSALAPTTLTFAPGQTSKIINVSVQGDTLDEANERLNVSLFGASNAFLGDSMGVGTIVDNDAAPTISIADASQYEGNSGSPSFAFTLSLSAPSGRAISVSYATADGTATQPSDYTASSGSVTFLPGVTSATLNVPIIGDTVKEADETFLVNLSAPVSATIADNQATGTIRNDELPIISIAGSSVTEGDSGQSNVTFTVTLSQASTDAVSFDFTTAPGTATADVDYVSTSGNRTILPGDTSKTITVAINGDIDDEANETFLLVLSNPVNALMASSLPRDPSTGHAYELVAASLNWDNARTAAAARTNLGIAGHLATITSAAEQSYVANLISGTEAWMGALQPAGSPEPGGGFTWITGEPFTYTNWRSGEPNNAAPVGIQDTALFTYDGTWNDISTQATVAHYLVEYDSVPDIAQGVATILNDDTPPSLSVNNLQVVEGSGGTNNAVFTITVNGVSKKPISVDAATQDGTALAGADYQAVNRTIQIPVGQASTTFSVPIITDLLDEDNETFTVNLSNPVNATLAFGAGLPRDPATGHAYELVAASLSWRNAKAAAAARSYFGVTGHLATVTSAAEQSFIATVVTDKQAYLGALQPAGSPEPGGGFTWITGEPFVYTNWRSGEPNNANPTGIEDTLYYTSNGGTWNDISADVVDAGVTYYLVEYDNAANTAQAVATITDDDATPSLSVNDVQVVEGSGGTNNAIFTINMSAASGRTVAVDVITQNGTASSGADYQAVNRTVLIAVGQISATVVVPITTDLLDENNETFMVNLSGPANATLGDSQGTGTITDDDGAPALSINDVSVLEGQSGTVAATFTVSLAAPSGKSVTVKYATESPLSNAATANVDYVSVPLTTLTFAPGQTSQSVTVQVNGDTLDENNEKLLVRLSAPTNATIADSTGYCLITDDDAPSFSINDKSVAEGNSGTTSAVFTVSLSAASTQTVTVDYGAVKGTTNPAIVGSDFLSTKGTLTFNPGDTTKTITVPIIGDYVVEADETFFVSLSAPAGGATISDGQGLGTITNDDFDTTAPSVSFTTSATTPIGTTPVSGSTVSGTMPTITGIGADSASGVAKVELRLYRPTATAGAYEYWTGIAWTTTVAALSTVMNPPAGGANVTWSRSNGWPGGGDFADGTYYLRATAYDKAGNLKATLASNFKKVTSAGQTLQPFATDEPSQ